MCSHMITQIGQEYIVAGDGATYHHGTPYTGVWLNKDGAWAGRVIGGYLETIDAEGQFVPAKEDWADHIVARLAHPAEGRWAA